MATFSRVLRPFPAALILSLLCAGVSQADTLSSPVVLASGTVSGSGSLNSLGEAVWVQYDPGTGFNQIYSSWRGRLSADPTDHYAPVINDRGDVAWLAYDRVSFSQGIIGFIGGKRLTVAHGVSTDKLDLSDAGEVIWSQTNNDGTSHVYSNLRGQLTRGSLDTLRPSINNAGTIAFSQTDPNTGSPQIFQLPMAGSIPQEVTPAGTSRSDVAINDAGELVWTETDPSTSITSIVSSSRGQLVSQVSPSALDLNNCGDVLYSVAGPGGSTVYQLGGNSPCVSYPGGHATFDQAAAVTVGKTFTGLVDGTAAPVNWYRFEAATGDTIKIGSYFDSRAPNTLSLALYDGQGNLLSGSAGSPPAIRTAAYSGSYYLQVAGQGGRFGYAVTVEAFGDNCNSGLCAEPVVTGNLNPGASLNSLGETVWSQLEPLTGRYQVWSSLRGPLTYDAVDHKNAALNNLGDVVWTEYDALAGEQFSMVGNIGGKRVTLGVTYNDVAKLDINDRREAVFSVYDWITGSYQVFSSVRGQLTGGPADNLDPTIDNQGNITFLQHDLLLGSYQVMKVAAGSNLAVPVTSDNAYRLDVAANEGGEAVWSQLDLATGSGAIVSSLRGELMGGTATSLDINSCSDLLYRTVGPDGPAIFRLGSNTPCVSLPGTPSSMEQATAVSFGDVFTGQLDSAANPAAWYRFDASSGDSFHVVVNYDPTSPNALAGGIYDSLGNLVGALSSYDPALINFPVPKSGTYYLKLQATGGSFGFAVSLSKYTSNCGAAVCPEQLPSVSQIGEGISLNSLGDALWSQYDDASGHQQIFSLLRGRLTTGAVDHAAPSLNNVGDQVWVEFDQSQSPATYILHGTVAGQPFTLATGSNFAVEKTDINDSREIVWSQGGAVYSSLRGQLIGSASGGGHYPSINNQGDLLFLRQGSSGYQVFKLAAGSSTPELVTDNAFQHHDAAISDSGELVWSEVPEAGAVALESSSRGTLLAAGNIGSVDVNSCGDVLYVASTVEGSGIYRLGNNAPCVSFPGSHDTLDSAALVPSSGTFTGLADSTTAPSLSWYRIDASAGDTLHVAVNYTGSAPLNLALYDASRQLLTQASGASPTLLAYPVTVSAPYYLAVAGTSGRVGYAVSVSHDSVPPSVKLVAGGLADQYFSTLSQPFSQAPAVPAFQLLLKSGDFSEEVSMNLCGGAVTMSGGYDASFAAFSGESRIDGTLRVKCGKLIADGVAIR